MSSSSGSPLINMSPSSDLSTGQSSEQNEETRKIIEELSRRLAAVESEAKVKEEQHEEALKALKEENEKLKLQLAVKALKEENEKLKLQLARKRRHSDDDDSEEAGPSSKRV